MPPAASAWLEVRLLPWAVAVRVRDLPTPGRVFAAVAGAGGPRPILGRGVLDEFQTLSGPLLLGPRELAGALYDAGLAASFGRDPGMGLDAGWPPLVIGIEWRVEGEPAEPADLREVLSRWSAGSGAAPPRSSRPPVHTLATAAGRVDLLRVAEATVVATGAPLLPRQLRRLAAALVADPLAVPAEEPGRAAVAVALAAGHPLPTPAAGETLAVPFLAEGAFGEHLRAIVAGVPS